MTAEVECYAGSTYPESPRAFLWESHHYVVDEIISRRREPNGIGFLVQCSPGGTLFDLYYQIDEDEWRIKPKGAVIIDQKTQTQPDSQGD